MADVRTPASAEDHPHVRRVLFAPETHLDESLIGLVRRCAMENEISSVEPIIGEATGAPRAWYNLAVRDDLDRRAG